jgi:pimeloyl-ACP methyl ester carboxylesterase
MHHRRYLIGLIFLLFAGGSVAATKSDTAKEKRWEEQIVPSLLVGEPVKLKSGDVEFLGLYAENTDEQPRGGAIIIHGIGAHPAWPDIIDPVRMALPEHGWSTLSLQMPILANEAGALDYLPLMDEAPGRIQAGVDFLKDKGVKNIVIIAHSMGTTMANVYLAAKPDPAVHAYIAIGMSNPFPAKYDNAAALAKITIPVLNLYGSQDLESVIAFADARAASARKVNKHYTQIQVTGANHFFNNMQDDLIKRIRGWLLKNASGKTSKSYK